jgi:hypothetical protein
MPALRGSLLLKVHTKAVKHLKLQGQAELLFLFGIFAFQCWFVAPMPTVMYLSTGTKGCEHWTKREAEEKQQSR